MLRALVAIGLVVATAATAAALARDAEGPRGAGLERPPAGTGGRGGVHEELDRPDRALRRADEAPRSRDGRRPPSLLQARDAGARKRERAVRTERPRKGLTITRDRWGVPHIKGTTAEDVAFGAGWATAADRQLIMELLRGPGRIAALDAPGVNAFAFALSGRTFRPSAARRPPGAAVRPAPRPGRRGARGDTPDRRVRRGDQRAVQEGRPAACALDAQRRRRGRRVDRRRVRLRGRAGGAPVAVPRLAAAQVRRRAGRQVWEDLRQRDDPEARVAVPGRFERTMRQTSEVGNVVVDPTSFAPAGLSAATTTRLPMSNALLVGARRSTTGKPLFVAGPQVGHFYPGILLELDLEGGGYKTRGAAFPGVSFGVLLGRGIDYAWSATSAGSDLVDEYVETLCGGGETSYLYRGECRPMGTFDAGDDRRPAGRAGSPARLPRDDPRAGQGLRDRRGQARRDHVAALDPRTRARVAPLLPRPLDEPRPLGQGLPPRRVARWS